jgi:hypothetical protein
MVTLNRDGVLLAILLLGPAGIAPGQNRPTVVESVSVKSFVYGFTRFDGAYPINTVGYEYLGRAGGSAGIRATFSLWSRSLVPMPWIVEVDVGPALPLRAGERTLVAPFAGFSMVTLVGAEGSGALPGVHVGGQVVQRLSGRTAVRVSVAFRRYGDFLQPSQGHFDNRLLQIGIGRWK